MPPAWWPTPCRKACNETLWQPVWSGVVENSGVVLFQCASASLYSLFFITLLCWHLDADNVTSHRLILSRVERQYHTVGSRAPASQEVQAQASLLVEQEKAISRFSGFSQQHSIERSFARQLCCVCSALFLFQFRPSWQGESKAYSHHRSAL